MTTYYSRVFIPTIEAISAGLRIFAKGIGAQLDFWLGNHNNTIGYRPEISDLNHLKGFGVNWGREGVFRFRCVMQSDEIFRDQLQTPAMRDPKKMLLIIVMICNIETF